MWKERQIYKERGLHCIRILTVGMHWDTFVDRGVTWDTIVDRGVTCDTVVDRGVTWDMVVNIKGLLVILLWIWGVTWVTVVDTVEGLLGILQMVGRLRVKGELQHMYYVGYF